MKKKNEIIVLNNCDYELIKNYRDAYDRQELEDKFTDYFYDYDYVVGDIAYNKLRLKGFYDEGNKKKKRINNYKYVDDYLKKNCANDCKHFIIKKVSNK
ncbi:MAG: YutD-like domain-containing protein [Bacilli bacterium]|nr:YutD-like domain-containing protein [Bacilli bacterium]